MKVRIFVDFWNFQLSVRDNTPVSYKLDWGKLSPFLVTQATNLIGQSLTFEETRVYMSFDPHKANDKNLRGWAVNVLDRFTGVHVTMLERKPKHPPVCQNCHKPIDNCPNCGNRMSGTIEKGVDTAIVTDLMGLAWESAWDVAVLLTSDRDFVPAVEKLAIKGYRVINAHFPPLGMELARVCWASIDLIKHMRELQRT
jgi:uncharacterized LabA/DUF88 family protein